MSSLIESYEKIMINNSDEQYQKSYELKLGNVYFNNNNNNNIRTIEEYGFKATSGVKNTYKKDKIRIKTK